MSGSFAWRLIEKGMEDRERRGKEMNAGGGKLDVGVWILQREKDFAVFS